MPDPQPDPDEPEGVNLGFGLTLEQYRELTITRPLTWGPIRLRLRMGHGPDKGEG
jgi:hypothetical protein